MSDHTTDKLRHDIDAGHGADKVAASDPAAAPLGTDDEAAGTPPSRDAVRLARAHGLGRRSLTQKPGHGAGVLIYLTLISILVAGFVTGVWLAG
ncbi:MAG: hypothetical protein NW223_15490 [Hyphomicrobiaceae bacterium]|nr:hypothetical protein [Hyphomicrobiaceae bacterium]